MFLVREDSKKNCKFQQSTNLMTFYGFADNKRRLFWFFLYIFCLFFFPAARYMWRKPGGHTCPHWWMDGWMDGLMDVWIDGLIGALIEGQALGTKCQTFIYVWIYISMYIYVYIHISFMYSTRIYVRNGWTDLKNSFLLVPSWSGEGFRRKKFWIFEKKISRIFLQSILNNSS